MSENIGCCSSYVKCSDNLKCLHIGESDYDGCMYRQNLESGKVFYGKNAGKVIDINGATDNVRWKSPRRIYLDCFTRFFHVGHLSSKGYTYPLLEDEFELVKTYFSDCAIPFFEYEMEKLIKDFEQKCIIEGDEREPANARIIFKIPGCEQEFVVGNYNVCCIRKRYADLISKAMSLKGFVARVELSGNYAKVVDYDRNREAV